MYAETNQGKSAGLSGGQAMMLQEDPGQRTIAENLDRKMQQCMEEYERLKGIKAKLGGNQPLLALTIGELRRAMDY